MSQGESGDVSLSDADKLKEMFEQVPLERIKAILKSHDIYGAVEVLVTGQQPPPDPTVLEASSSDDSLPAPTRVSYNREST